MPVDNPRPIVPSDDERCDNGSRKGQEPCVPEPTLEPRLVELLAQRLLAYHGHQVLVTPFGSWLAVTEDLIEAPVTGLAYDEDAPDLKPGDNPDKHYPVKPEALRRFALRISDVPKDLALLDDIRKFLIFKGFLSPSDLELHAAPFHLTCALAQIFGAECFASPTEATTRFAGDFLGRFESDHGTVEFLVSMLAAPDGASLQIRETSLSYRRRPPEPMAHLRGRVERSEPCRIASRDGVALLTPRSGIIFGLCAEAEDEGAMTPGGVFLVQEVTYGSNRVQSFTLVGEHHLHAGDKVTLHRCDGSKALNRMRRIMKAVTKNPKGSR